MNIVKNLSNKKLVMPLVVDDSINSLSNYFEKSWISRIVQNPIYTALLITFIIILTILYVFRDATITADESLTRMAIRSGIYMFFITTFVIFMQNNSVIREYKDKFKDNTIAQRFDAVEGGFAANKIDNTIGNSVDSMYDTMGNATTDYDINSMTNFLK